MAFPSRRRGRGSASQRGGAPASRRAYAALALRSEVDPGSDGQQHRPRPRTPRQVRCDDLRTNVRHCDTRHRPRLRTRTFELTAYAIRLQRGAGRPPMQYPTILRTLRDELGARSQRPRPPRLRRHLRFQHHPSWPIARPLRQRVRRWAAPMLHEEVLALGTSCSHSRPGWAAQQAAAPYGCLLFCAAAREPRSLGR